MESCLMFFVCFFFGIMIVLVIIIFFSGEFNRCWLVFLDKIVWVVILKIWLVLYFLRRVVELVICELVLIMLLIMIVVLLVIFLIIVVGNCLWWVLWLFFVCLLMIVIGVLLINLVNWWIWFILVWLGVIIIKLLVIFFFMKYLIRVGVVSKWFIGMLKNFCICGVWRLMMIIWLIWFIVSRLVISLVVIGFCEWVLWFWWV